jgi:hypothetical protein
VTPGAQTETAYCSTSAVNPATGQNSPAATDYNEFFVYCTVTPSDGSAIIKSTQCPAGYPGYLPAGSSAGGNPTGQCSFTFQPKPAVTYTINSRHGLQFGTLSDCPSAPTIGGGFAWCYVDPGGFWASTYASGIPTYTTQSSSVTQEVTYPGPAQDIPYWGIGQYTSSQDSSVASSSAKWAASCPTPNITSISPKTWFAGRTYNPVTITGTNFTTTANATSACPVNTVTVTTPDGSAVSVSGVNIASATSITASVQPASTAPTESATVTVSGNPAATTTAQIVKQPTITSISPTKILVGGDDVQVTISGSGFGTSPTVNLPTGVTSSAQTSSDSQIVITLSANDTATVGNSSISVTANGETSDAQQFVLDGPYQMTVTNDLWGYCSGCTTTIYRTLSYQVQNFSGSNAGASTFCELPSDTNWNCNQSQPTISGNTCPNGGYNSLDGTFEDTWTLVTDNWTPIGCGADTVDPWYWAYTSPTAPIGTPSGYVHTDVIQIDGVQTPNKLPNGTVIPK